VMKERGFEKQTLQNGQSPRVRKNLFLEEQQKKNASQGGRGEEGFQGKITGDNHECDDCQN